ncbi:hypothetical protein FKW77_001373 [Venturia effusa]|uniref:Glycosyl hydrolase family 32 N-terminal domain-containing protein n=1 Tax=Venturia effusa TaxID=50376 RepID=A0A517L8L0_9PEZI|nr:hypothetical protein FKW77_001373 [Venturia effusa]
MVPLLSLSRLFALGLLASQAIAASIYTDYVFAFFTGENSADGEQIYLAVSNNNSPASWTLINGGKPVLTSTVGTKGVRDPTIVRSKDGSKFWILATDLKIFGNGDWNAASRTGSRSIVVWESSDLKTWSGPNLVQVSPATAGSTWAPEAVYDPASGSYMAFWASKLYPESDPAHATTSYYRILKSKTSDFKTFSTPEVWINTGSSVIDTTVVFDSQSNKYYRFSKDERSGTPNGKFIFQESGSSLSGPWTPVKEGIGKGTIARGEGPTVFQSNTDENLWHMLIDEFGSRGYVAFETTNIAAGDWKPSTGYVLPKRPRHGSIIPITAAERAALLSVQKI